MLKDKQGIIFGVANKRSIAWATAQALHEAGAQLAFAYQGERLKENVERLTAEEMPARRCFRATSPNRKKSTRHSNRPANNSAVSIL
jgi:enoyl-[acyl-carrier protein] reductase I